MRAVEKLRQTEMYAVHERRGYIASNSVRVVAVSSICCEYAHNVRAHERICMKHKKRAIREREEVLRASALHK